MGLRIGFHYHVPAISQGGKIYMPGYLGCFIDSLASFCENIACFLHSPRQEDATLMDYSIRAENVDLINIGPFTSVMNRSIKSRIYTNYLRGFGDKLDILLLRGPSPLLPAMFSASPVPTALLLVGDYLKGVNDLPQPCWRKEAIRVWSYWNRLGQDRAARQSLTFVNSRILYNELSDKVSHLHEVRTTTLTKKDFYTRVDTCQSRPVHLLYVGRMDRAKGLLQMINAIKLLTEWNEDVVLDLVGWEEHGDPVLEEIRSLSIAKGISERINFLGSRPLGPELFECYNQSDIFLNASLSSEGFPRTIWEAMAHSIPVIATRVGSIPAIIDDVAELVSPGRADALANAILKLIHNPEMRKKMIYRGYKLAQTNTLEIQASNMISIIESWLSR